MREEIVQALKKTATEYDVLPVQHSNALQGALADQLTKFPRTMKRMAVGGGLGLLAGILADTAGASNDRYWPVGVGTTTGLGVGLGLAGIYDGISRGYELSDDVKAYRGAEARQQLAREEAKRKKEQEKAVSKTASAGTDLVGNIGWGLVPGIGALNLVGHAAGAIEGTQSEEEEKHTDKSPALSIIPGVGAYRTQRRLKRQMTDPETGSTKHYWSSLGGNITSIAAPMLLGAAIGWGAGADRGSKEDMAASGALIGGLGGALANGVAAPIAAFVTPRRSKDEQREASKSWLANLLVPGVGSYNQWKALGRALGDSEERELAPPESTVNINMNSLSEMDDERLKKLVTAAIANKA